MSAADDERREWRRRQQETDRVRELLREGKSRREVAAMTGVSLGRVIAISRSR